MYFEIVAFYTVQSATLGSGVISIIVCLCASVLINRTMYVNKQTSSQEYVKGS